MSKPPVLDDELMKRLFVLVRMRMLRKHGPEGMEWATDQINMPMIESVIRFTEMALWEERDSARISQLERRLVVGEDFRLTLVREIVKLRTLLHEAATILHSAGDNAAGDKIISALANGVSRNEH